ncbi:uncharacterized protein L201_004155 [Kwoniella dendrophila CBS 6074]|uniref:RecA family profile 1 domain-containing protein n=1 Tax=Kwoniella dendrophila CBS 6074 TaxID=1295534 RepID=A0AAX4JV71_9TREE
MTTEKLLSEIEVGTAAELALSVRYHNFPLGPTFIPFLDELILEGRSHRGGSSLMRGDLIELVGASGSGKTTFIIYLIFTTILPKTLPDFLNTPIGGKEQSVTLIQPITHKNVNDLITKLKKLIKNHILHISPKLSNELVEKVIRDSLSKLKIYKIKPRYKDLALTLKLILSKSINSPRSSSKSKSEPTEEHEEDKSASKTSTTTEEGLDLLCIDGIGDSHYTSRWSHEQKGINNMFHYDKSSNRILGSDEIGLKQVMECIGRIRKELGTVVVMSKQGLRASKESSSFFHTHLPPPYPSPWSNIENNRGMNESITNKSLIDPTYWPLNIQITFQGSLKPLQYPSELTLVDLLTQISIEKKKKKQQQLYTNQVGGNEELKIFECIVRMIETSQGPVSSRSGGKFRFGINDQGLLTHI